MSVTIGTGAGDGTTHIAGVEIVRHGRSQGWGHGTLASGEQP